MQITEEQARDRLKAKIGYSMKVKDLAVEFGVSSPFMSMVLAGKRDMTEPMLKAIDVTKITTFETTP